MTDSLHCPDCGIPTIQDRAGLTEDDLRYNECTQDNEFMSLIVGVIDRARATGIDEDEEIDRTLKADGWTSTPLFDTGGKQRGQ